MATIVATLAGHGAHNRVRMNRTGLWLFILSECFLFGSVLSARYYLQAFDRPDEVNQALGLALTVLLLASSLTAYRAEVFAHHGDRSRFMHNIIATLVMGALFVVGVGIEWQQAFRHFPPSTGYGTILFTTTGLHAFHVVTGLLALVVVAWLGRSGRFSGVNAWPVEGAVKYWHFVDVAWVFIYPTLYLVG